uniref:Fibronectin type-III domain-containing protein n=1 Tax=Amphimedon queenslandica TaxID=400682 RepID=A0A1X7VV73_AMPQE
MKMCLYACCIVLSLSLTLSHSCLLTNCRNNRNDIQMQSEETFLRAIKCQDYCLRQYGVKLPNVSIVNVWPTRNVTDLQNNCRIYQKVEQCQLGCVISKLYTDLTPNKCRNKCYSLCKDSCNGETRCAIHDNSCSRKCGKTFCKKGCLHKVDNNGYIPPVPVAPPILMQTEEEYAYAVTYNQTNGINNNNNNNSEPDWVNFLFKVTDINEGITQYYWQSDLTQTLKLTGFSCRAVNVSVSVISRNHQTPYSPPATLCINNEKFYPSQIAAETIVPAFREDKEHSSFVEIDIQWEGPETNAGAVTSYSVFVLSTQEECGGMNKLFTYNDIKQNNISIKTDGSNQFPRFGCTYHLIVKAYPSRDDTDGTQVTIIPKLPEFNGSVELNCSSVRIGDGPVILMANWSHSGNEAISHYLLDIKHEKEMKIKANVSQSQYRVSKILSDIQDDHIHVNLSSQKRSDYYWRPLPYPASCSVQVPVHVPLAVLVDQKIDEYNNNISFNISWSTISSNITHIQLLIGQNLNIPQYSYVIKAQLKEFFISIERNNDDTYLWARSVQEAMETSWNNPIKIKGNLFLSF